MADKDQSRAAYGAPHASASDVAASAPSLGAPILSAKLKAAPNIANPSASAAFATAPRAFNPTQTAFASR